MAAVTLTDADREALLREISAAVKPAHTLACPSGPIEICECSALPKVEAVERIVAAHVETVLARLDNPALRDEVAAAIETAPDCDRTPYSWQPEADAALSVVKTALRGEQP